ncbi:MAG: hypothetical protein LBV32_10785 [Tannerellaceae bacterium]|jgi:hypothetical protein|nr:hypothetical protein [Tannerellaceae bacterium]
MSKARIKQVAMKNAIRIWGVTNVDQLDPVVKLFIEVFSALINDNENAIADIKERLLEQIAHSLTPDSLISAKPAHSVMKAMPVEAEMEIGRRDIFYTDRLTSAAQKYEMKHLNFSPVTDHIKLVKGEIQYILCERNLYQMGLNNEKDLVTRASSFYQDLNRTIWLGFNLSSEVKTLKNIHFYFDFPNTDYRYDLYDLLTHTAWDIDGNRVAVEAGLANTCNEEERYGGIFSHYNISYRNDEEVLELYRKQFLHIKSHIETRKLIKTPFPVELTPFFSKRVSELEPQYWIKIVFPPFFKSEDLEDINISLNAFPVSNKNLNHTSLEREKELVGIIPLSVAQGEFFLSPDKVDDTMGKQYNFLPFSTGGGSLGGTYTLKKDGLERFSTHDLAETIEELIDLFRSEAVTFNALKMENIRSSVSKMEQFIATINSRLEINNTGIKEIPTYLLIDSEDKNNTIYASYWTSNCHIANNLPYGTLFKPLKALPVEKDSCMFLKASTGGHTSAKSREKIEAYKYALTTRDQLYSISDIENYCRMKYTDKIQYVKVRLGVSVSSKKKEGFIRTLDVNLVPSDEYRSILSDPIKQGELKEDLSKRSPELYNYRIIVLDKLPY